MRHFVFGEHPLKEYNIVQSDRKTSAPVRVPILAVTGYSGCLKAR